MLVSTKLFQSRRIVSQIFLTLVQCETGIFEDIQLYFFMNDRKKIEKHSTWTA